jgi:uncharacterized protein YukE
MGSDRGSYLIRNMCIATQKTPESWKLEDVKAVLAATNPGKVTSAGQKYKDASKSFSDAAAALESHISQIKKVWGGDASEGAVQQFKQLQTTATSLSKATAQAGAVLETHGSEYLSWYKEHGANLGDGFIRTGSDDAAAREFLDRANVRVAETFNGMPLEVSKDLPTGSDKVWQLNPPDSGDTGGGWDGGGDDTFGQPDPPGGSIGGTPPGGGGGGGGGGGTFQPPNIPGPTDPGTGTGPIGTGPGDGGGSGGTPPGGETGVPPIGGGGGGSGPGDLIGVPPGGLPPGGLPPGGLPPGGLPPGGLPPGGLPPGGFPPGGLPPVGGLPPGGFPPGGFPPGGAPPRVGPGPLGPGLRPTLGLTPPGFGGGMPPGGVLGGAPAGRGGALGPGGPRGAGARGVGPGGVIGGRQGAGMPMGGGANGGSDEQELERSTWLVEDDDVWQDHEDVPPPVIG